jgi:hypothetical protein
MCVVTSNSVTARAVPTSAVFLFRSPRFDWNRTLPHLRNGTETRQLPAPLDDRRSRDGKIDISVDTTSRRSRAARTNAENVQNFLGYLADALAASRDA